MDENLIYHPETLLVTLPPAIRVYPEFITEGEEAALLKEFETLDWKQLHHNGVIEKRKVVHYGQAPFFLEPLIPRVSKLMHVKPATIHEIVLTHYPQGAGIGWHHDAEEFGEVVAGITLGSGCTMKFRHPVGSQFEIFKTDLPDRSAYVIADEARWDWQHTIASHRTPRFTITFRAMT